MKKEEEKKPLEQEDGKKVNGGNWWTDKDNLDEKKGIWIDL